MHYPRPWVFLGVTFSCGGPLRGSGISCPFPNRLFEHPVQILPGLTGDNCLNSPRAGALPFSVITPTLNPQAKAFSMSWLRVSIHRVCPRKSRATANSP